MIFNVNMIKSFINYNYKDIPIFFFFMKIFKLQVISSDRCSYYK